MDLAVVILLIVLTIWSRAAKQQQKKKSEGAKQLMAQSAARRQPDAKPAAARPVPPAKADKHPEPVTEKPLTFGAFEHAERDGSIEMPAIEAHKHEGKPLPCPAEEREQPRPRPAQLAPQRQAASRPGMQLSFSQSSVVQAVVMSEILTRPRFESGRRMIR